MSNPTGQWHTADPGDSLSLLGERHRIPWQTIWEHPDNADLRRRRGNPNILHPGDRVFIPEPKPKEVSCAPNKSHRFRTSGADCWDVPKVSPASSPGTDFNSDPRSAKRCRGIPAHSNNRENWIAASCWAFAGDRCPHGMNPTVLAKLREEDRRLDAERKAAEKKAAKKP